MMSTKKYRIRLTTDEQQELNALVSRGRAAAYKQTHARILLMSDESRSDGGMKDADITSAIGVGQSTVERIRKRCVEEGVESALNRKKQLRRRQKRLDGSRGARTPDDYHRGEHSPQERPYQERLRHQILDFLANHRFTSFVKYL